MNAQVFVDRAGLSRVRVAISDISCIVSTCKHAAEAVISTRMCICIEQDEFADLTNHYLTLIQFITEN